MNSHEIRELKERLKRRIDGGETLVGDDLVTAKELGLVRAKAKTFPELFAEAFVLAGSIGEDGEFIPPRRFPFDPSLGTRSEREFERSVHVACSVYPILIEAYRELLAREGKPALK